MNNIKLWLDDIRPAPPGWTHVFTVQEAKDIMLSTPVLYASLDHDLGACKECLGGMTPDQWLQQSNYTQMPNCDHFGTGYTLVCWMEEMDIWPVNKPVVHSANPAGRAKCRPLLIRNGVFTKFNINNYVLPKQSFNMGSYSVSRLIKEKL